MNDTNGLTGNECWSTQRLPVSSLKRWEELGLGVFLHFGMSTFEGVEISSGARPSTDYAPTDLDVAQWLGVARDAGFRYAILTAKHTSGHCLWPSRYTDYHVGTSSDSTDVVEKFVDACAKMGVLPGLYYCAWDNHHRFGSSTPSDTAWRDAFTTAEYQQFHWNQLTELASQYGRLSEIWLDIPGVLPRDFRNRLYAHLASLQPDAVIASNHGMNDGSDYNVAYAWPSDIITIEKHLPTNSRLARPNHVPWREIEGKQYYLPGEVCDTIGGSWFYEERDLPKADDELLGLYLLCRSRGTNLLLNVPPGTSGIIDRPYIEALNRFQRRLAALRSA